MADLSDVENALLLTLQSALYPQGNGSASVTGSALRLYRGWPLQPALAVDISSGIANVSIFPVPTETRNTTRWGVQVCRPAPTPGTTVTVVSNTVTIGGTPAVGDIVGLLLGNLPFAYAVAQTDTPVSIAAALADMARGYYSCLQAASTLTFSGAPRLIARATAIVDVLSEWARQEQGFRISVWAPSPATRDVLGKFISAALAPLTFMTLADGSGARLRYRHTAVLDEERDSSIYRRDMVYDVEYPTTSAVAISTMLFGELNWNTTPYYG